MRDRRLLKLPRIAVMLVALIGPIALPGQEASRPTNSAADTGPNLAVLRELGRPLPSASLSNGKRLGRGELATLYLARADQARAKPGGVVDLQLAAEAKRVEALNLAWAALHGDGTQRERMTALVAAVRQESLLPEIRRFEVVAWSFQADLARQRGADRTARMRGQETLARALIAEFPRQREGYESLLAIARDTTPEHARAIVSDLGGLQIPTDLQREAAVVLAQQALVGKPLKDVIATTGLPDPWSSLADSNRIVYCWDGASVGTLAPFLAKLAVRFPQLRWAGICIDADVSRAQTLAASAALIGLQYYGNANSNPVAEALSFRTAGQAYLVDRTGGIRCSNALMESQRKLGGLSQ